MKEIVGNIWSQQADAICITTNGVVKKNGEAVMGAGVAKQAQLSFPELPKKLGDRIKNVGHTVGVIHGFSNSTDEECHCPKYTYLVSFPTKNYWFEDSDPVLIEKSCKELVELTDNTKWKNVVLPRPGCGNGKLSWIDVKPILAKYFDDRFSIIEKETN